MHGFLCRTVVLRWQLPFVFMYLIALWLLLTSWLLVNFDCPGDCPPSSLFCLTVFCVRNYARGITWLNLISDALLLSDSAGYQWFTYGHLAPSSSFFVRIAWKLFDCLWTCIFCWSLRFWTRQIFVGFSDQRLGNLNRKSKLAEWSISSRLPSIVVLSS